MPFTNSLLVDHHWGVRECTRKHLAEREAKLLVNAII